MGATASATPVIEASTAGRETRGSHLWPNNRRQISLKKAVAPMFDAITALRRPCSCPIHSCLAVAIARSANSCRGGYVTIGRLHGEQVDGAVGPCLHCLMPSPFPFVRSTLGACGASVGSFPQASVGSAPVRTCDRVLVFLSTAMQHVSQPKCS